jgi:hypothetical protein
MPSVFIYSETHSESFPLRDFLMRKQDQLVYEFCHRSPDADERFTNDIYDVLQFLTTQHTPDVHLFLGYATSGVAFYSTSDLSAFDIAISPVFRSEDLLEAAQFVSNQFTVYSVQST